MTELFLFGSLLFWLLVAVELVLLFVFVEFDNGIGATISLVVFGALLQWCGNVDIISFVKTNPWQVGGGLLAYFMLGASWGVVKWWLFCKDHAEDYKDAKAKFLQSKNLSPNLPVIPENLREAWKNHLIGDWHGPLKGERSGLRLNEQLYVRNHKALVLRWMSFWIISMIWSFINDFVKRMFRAIYYRIANFLQRISDNIWQGANADEDLKIPVNETTRERD